MTPSSVICLEKIHGECRDDDGMVNLPCSDQFWDIHQRDEHDLDVFSLIGDQVRNLLDILG